MRVVESQPPCWPVLLALALSACSHGSAADSDLATESGGDNCEPVDVQVEPDSLVEPYGLTAEELAADLVVEWHGEAVWLSDSLVDSVPWNDPTPIVFTHDSHAYSIQTQCGIRRLLVDSWLSMSVDGTLVVEKPARAFAGLVRENESWDGVPPGFLEFVEVRGELEDAGVVFAEPSEGSFGASMIVHFLRESREVSITASHSVMVTEDIGMVQTSVITEFSLWLGE